MLPLCKLKVPRREGHPRLSRWSQRKNRSPHKGKEESRRLRTKAGVMKREAERCEGVRLLALRTKAGTTGQRKQRPLDAGKGKKTDSLLSLQEECSSADTLILGFLPPELWEMWSFVTTAKTNIDAKFWDDNWGKDRDYIRSVGTHPVLLLKSPGKSPWYPGELLFHQEGSNLKHSAKRLWIWSVDPLGDL